MVISPGGTGFKSHLCTALGDLGQLLRGHEMGMTLSQGGTRNLGQAEVRPGPGQKLAK